MRASYFLISGVIALAPHHPYLGQGVWPIAQHDTYAQASTSLAGPSILDDLSTDSLMNTALAGALTVLYSSDNQVLWGASLRAIFKVDRSGPRLRLIDAVAKPAELLLDDTFRGIYSFLSESDVFYTYVGPAILGYEDVDDESPRTSNITRTKQYYFDDAKEGEVILAISRGYDGSVFFISNRGSVGVVSPDLRTRLDLVRLESFVKNTTVSNSIAVDEHGGIYVVTSTHMVRVWWDGTKLHVAPEERETRYPCGVAGQKCAVWRMPYDVEMDAFFDRPTKYGSGTTPSLMKDEATGRIYVVIADGLKEQSIVVFDEDGSVAATFPVDFGVAGSYTEQSLLVHGMRILVVQNAMTDSGKRLANLMSRWGLASVASTTKLPKWVTENALLLPVALGDSPRGYQMLEFDPSSGGSLRSVWRNLERGCPNSIPSYSEETNALYCVSRQTSLEDKTYPRDGFKGAWAVEALDWDTGEQLFSFPTGSDFRFNSFYAACQIGVDREIVHGSIGGLVRVRPTTMGAVPIVAKKAHANPWLWAISRVVDMAVGQSTDEIPSEDGPRSGRTRGGSRFGH